MTPVVPFVTRLAAVISVLRSIDVEDPTQASASSSVMLEHLSKLRGEFSGIDPVDTSLRGLPPFIKSSRSRRVLTVPCVGRLSFRKLAHRIPHLILRTLHQRIADTSERIVSLRLQEADRACIHARDVDECDRRRDDELVARERGLVRDRHEWRGGVCLREGDDPLALALDAELVLASADVVEEVTGEL